MPDDSHSTEASGGSLQAQVDELQRRRKAAGRFQGGHTYFQEEVEIFRAYAEEEGLFLEQAPPELNRVPDFEGNEHQVWFQDASNDYLKATWPGFFGKSVVFAADETANASPIAYLERWHLHNELFGDGVRFSGCHDSPQGLRLIIQQPAIEGKPASERQIRQFFEATGWQPFRIREDLAYFDQNLNVAISDTHRGNLILMADGSLAPIDLRVQQLAPNLVDAVRSLVAQY